MVRDVKRHTLKTADRSVANNFSTAHVIVLPASSQKQNPAGRAGFGFNSDEDVN
jgi:hypothetical protein